MERKNKHKIGKQYMSFELKDYKYDGESRTISGYGAIFGNRDKADDILVKGCFAKSIRERGPESSANDKIIMLWMHNMSEPIGRIVILKEDDKGLYFEAVIDEIPLGDRVIKQLESGTLNQFSIGYSYVWDKIEWDENLEAWIVKEVILYEISVVSIGCNGQTEYTGLKSLEEKESEFQRIQQEIEVAIKSLSFSQKSKINELISKIVSLSDFKPDKPLDRQRADKNTHSKEGAVKKSMFNVKLKKNE